MMTKLNAIDFSKLKKKDEEEEEKTAKVVLTGRQKARAEALALERAKRAAVSKNTEPPSAETQPAAEQSDIQAVQPTAALPASASATRVLPRVNTQALQRAVDTAYSDSAMFANFNYATAVQAAEQRLRQAEYQAAQAAQREKERIAAEEAKALDNAALYAAARGDSGGVGMGQFGAIQATAAGSRAAVESEKREYARDTALKIAELRAAGEYQRADAVLNAAQTRLQRMSDIYKWAAEQELEAAKLEQERSAAAQTQRAASDAPQTALPATLDTNKLFEKMRLSKSPYTWLISNAENYGFHPSNRMILDRIIEEYEKWRGS